MAIALAKVLSSELLDFGSCLVFPARSEQEERFKAIAPVGETYLVVIYTERNTKIRLISFRPAKRQERQRYQDVRKNR